MPENLLVWKWSEDYDTPAKRKKLKIKFSNVTSSFVEDADSPAFGDYDIDSFLDVIREHYPSWDDEHLFGVERYSRAICFSIPNSTAHDLIPGLGNLAMKHNLNGAQC